MRGIPYFNFPAFHAAAAALREQGHEVFSPAESDEARYGKGFSGANPAGDPHVAAANYGFSLRESLAIDCAYICREADAIALLPGWENSKGATAERALGIALNHKIIIVRHHDPI